MTEELQGLLAGATPLPWEAMDFEPEYPGDGVPIIGLRLNDDGDPLHTPTNGIVAAGVLLPTEIDALDSRRAEANAALIVAAVNALPGLLASLTAKDAEIAGLRAALGLIYIGDTEVFDDELQTDVTVAMDAEEMQAIANVALLGCTCGEVFGENPNCVAHGRSTEWAKANPEFGE